MTRFAAAPRVLVELSGFDTFGVDRGMLGSNLPVGPLFGPPARLFDVFAELTRGMSESERKAICRRNAEMAYRL
jgi:predicted TIM-barrel fold metal-dependent hydrolase